MQRKIQFSFGRRMYNILLNMNTKRIFFEVVFLIMVCSVTFSQETNTSKPLILTVIENNNLQTGRIEIIQPVQVENLLKMQIVNNRMQEEIPGYRIHIFSQSGQTAREKALETRGNFLRNFPEIESYLKFQSPNYLIVVGDFRTRNEALRERKKIEKIFPIAFIINDMINITK